MKAPKYPTPEQGGFALVSTLSVAALLTILTMALLGLAQSSARRSGQEKAFAEAQANARLSLKLAIGALQQQVGPDQRVSANAEILSDFANPTSTVASRHWTGVWNSWKAGSGEKSQHSTIGQSGEMAPKYETNRRDFFQGWLLSLTPEEARNVDTPKTLALDGKLLPQGTETALILVGPNTLGTDAPTTDQVSARLLTTSTATGKRNRHAYWIGDESQKTRLLADSYVGATSFTPLPSAQHSLPRDSIPRAVASPIQIPPGSSSPAVAVEHLSTPCRIRPTCSMISRNPSSTTA